MIAAGLMAAVGALMTWSTLTSGGERRTFSGLAVGDGRFTLAMGVVSILIGSVGLAKRPFPGRGADGRIALVLGVLTMALAAADVVAGPPTLASFRRLSANAITITSGNGLSLTITAGVGVIVGAALVLRGSSDR